MDKVKEIGILLAILAIVSVCMIGTFEYAVASYEHNIQTAIEESNYEQK